jgi:hypothetical protein
MQLGPTIDQVYSTLGWLGFITYPLEKPGNSYPYPHLHQYRQDRIFSSHSELVAK